MSVSTKNYYKIFSANLCFRSRKVLQLFEMFPLVGEHWASSTDFPKTENQIRRKNSVVVFRMEKTIAHMYKNGCS